MVLVAELSSPSVNRDSNDIVHQRPCAKSVRPFFYALSQERAQGTVGFGDRAFPYLNGERQRERASLRTRIPNPGTLVLQAPPCWQSPLAAGSRNVAPLNEQPRALFRHRLDRGRTTECVAITRAIRMFSRAGTRKLNGEFGSVTRHTSHIGGTTHHVGPLDDPR